MKVEDLRTAGLDEEQIKKVQALSGADVTAAKTASQSQIETLTAQLTDLQNTVAQRETDLADVRGQLEKAGQSATKLNEVQQSLASLESKYQTEKASYETKLNDQKYEFLVREKANGVNFSCGAAQREFISSLMENRLPIQDGALLGFDDYIAKRKESDPGAFKPDKAPEVEHKPSFVTPPDPNNNKAPTGEPTFGFNFVGVRKHD